MKRFLNIALNVLVWVVILAYLVFAVRLCRSEQQGERVGRVEIVVTDYDRLQIVSPAMVRGWLEGAGIALEGSPLQEVNTERIMAAIREHTFVKHVTAYTEQSGTLHVELSQRQPVMRVSRGDGGDFYVSDDLWILPTQAGTAEYVPIVTGTFGLPFEYGWHGKLEEPPTDGQKKLHQNYAFLLKLINFVRLTGTDPFWNAEIVQVGVRERDSAPDWKEPEIELVPRTGNHLILLGTLDGAQEKLEKLMLFYRNVLDYEGWDRYSRIDVRNRGQVVCRK